MKKIKTITLCLLISTFWGCVHKGNRLSSNRTIKLLPIKDTILISYQNDRATLRFGKQKLIEYFQQEAPTQEDKIVNDTIVQVLQKIDNDLIIIEDFNQENLKNSSDLLRHFVRWGAAEALLAQGQAQVIDRRTGEAVQTVKRRRYKGIMGGTGVNYFFSDGTEFIDFVHSLGE